MTPEERTKHWQEIDRELEELWARNVVGGDPATREVELLNEQDRLEREAAEEWVTDRDYKLRSCRIIGDGGNIITTEAEWELHAPPQEECHWAEYRSAMETCRAWLKDGSAVPKELYAVLQTRPETRCFSFADVYPEYVVSLDGFGGNHRNADIHAVATRRAKQLVLNVESKADEEFGTRIGPYFDAAVAKNAEEGRTRFSNIPTRINTLAQGIFGRAVDDTIRNLRYQLLYGLAAPILHAHRNSIGLAVLLIHEFVSHATTGANLRRNATDLSNFVHQIPAWESATITEGQLLPPVTLPGWPGVLVTLGKVRTVLT